MCFTRSEDHTSFFTLYFIDLESLQSKDAKYDVLFIFNWYAAHILLAEMIYY